MASSPANSTYATGVRPAIDNHLLALASQRRDYGEYWSASSAGYCMRKVIFDRLGVPHTSQDPRKQRVFSAGHVFHDWIQGITRATGFSIAQEVEIIDDNLKIKGHFDDLILIDERLILYDYKTQNSRAFQWQKKNGTGMSYFHRAQLGTYMYILRGLDIAYPLARTGWLTEARILKISKDDLCMSEEILFWDDKLEAEVASYWQLLNKHWNERTIPPCTCADHEGGFMAREKFNPYFFEGEPCSLVWYEKCKTEGLLKT